MKKFVLIMLALMLTVCAAQAQNMDDLLRERKLVVNGVEEMLTESKYVGQSGYSLWVDVDHFWPTIMSGGTNDEFVNTSSVLGDEERLVNVIMVSTEVPNAEMETFIGEAVALYPPENVTEAQTVVLPTGLEYCVQQAVEEGIVYRFYAVKGPEYLLCVTAGFPEAMAEEYIVRVDAMVNSIEFAGE